MKEAKYDNYRVVIEPYVSFPDKDDKERHQQFLRRCRGLIEDIKRHVDDIGHINFDFDVNYSCSHCGYEWDEDPDTKEPLCCQKAIDEFNSAKTTPLRECKKQVGQETDEIILNYGTNK